MIWWACWWRRGDGGSGGVGDMALWVWLRQCDSDGGGDGDGGGYGNSGGDGDGGSDGDGGGDGDGGSDSDGGGDSYVAARPVSPPSPRLAGMVVATGIMGRWWRRR